MTNFAESLIEFYSKDFIVVVNLNFIVPNLDVKTQFILYPRKQDIIFDQLFNMIYLGWLLSFYPDLEHLQVQVSYFTAYGRETPSTDGSAVVKFHQCSAPSIWTLGMCAAKICTTAIGDDDVDYFIRSIEFQSVDPIEVLTWRFENSL
jgi:hypothetical protein